MRFQSLLRGSSAMSHHGRATSVPNSSRDQKRQVTTDEARYRAEAATYIAELSADLAAMARGGFDYELARKVIDATSVDTLDEA